MNIKLKNIKIYDKLSNETTCFTAEIYNGRFHIGSAENEGNGGMTIITPCTVRLKIFNETERYINNLPDIEYPKDDKLPNLKVKSTFVNWVDFQVFNFHNLKIKKKFAKDMAKGIIYGEINSYKLVYWRNYTLVELINTPVGNALLQRKINEIKAQGHKILNTNLAHTGLILD